jgi:hypothetical protein
MEEQLFKRVQLLPEGLQIVKHPFTEKDQYYWLKPLNMINIKCEYDLWVNKNNPETEDIISQLKKYKLIPKTEYEHSYTLGPFDLDIELEDLIRFLSLFQQLDFREKDYCFKIAEDGKNIVIVEQRG